MNNATQAILGLIIGNITFLVLWVIELSKNKKLQKKK